jgi:hypothetical protein
VTHSTGVGSGSGAPACRKRTFYRTRWIARLPQEDFFQRFRLPHSLRYQADGGPSIQGCLQLLATSDTNFALEQLVFLAASNDFEHNFLADSHVGIGHTS